LGSLANVISSLTVIAQQGKCTNCQYSEGYYIVNLIVHAIFLLIAGFGTMVLCCRPRASLLRTYSTLYWIVVIDKNTFISACENSNASGNTNQDCELGYKVSFVLSVVLYGVAILISIHFASVIRAYSSQRGTEEENANMEK
ncbi:6171_t:CDS:2, partial [Dentiscutata erythropus]